jgi:hypothetical protein
LKRDDLIPKELSTINYIPLQSFSLPEMVNFIKSVLEDVQ